MNGTPPQVPLTAADTPPSRRTAWIYACLAVTLWAANVIPVKIALREIHGLPTSLMRVTLAGTVLLLLHVRQGKSLHDLRSSLREFLSIGFLGIAVSFVCFTTAIEFTSVSHAVFIGALLPLLVLCVVSIQGKERPSVGRMLGFILALAGITLLEIDRTVVGASAQALSNWRGDLLAVGGVCCFTFYTIRGKHLSARYDSFTVNTLAFGVGAAISLPVLLGISATGLPNALAPDWSSVTWVAWISILISGTVGSALPYFVYCRAMQRLKATQVATLAYVQPVIATLLGVAFLGERLGPQFAVAAGLILVGVFIAERG
jgi:drug/metabolite transporter (DMT)-like permease